MVLDSQQSQHAQSSQPIRDTTQQLHVVFVGRWESEKWVDAIVDARYSLAAHHPDVLARMKFSFFGDGSCRNLLVGAQREISALDLTLYGWTPKADIYRFCQQHAVDVFLMPSLFLETFGLVAGEAIAHGIPVITRKKWWAAQFVLDDLFALDTYRDMAACFLSLVELSADALVWYRHHAQKKALLYTKKQRYDTFQQICDRYNISLQNDAKILFVSDYKAILWGIERHILDVMWYMSRFFSPHLFAGSFQSVWMRRIGLWWSSCNLWAAWWFLRAVFSVQPALIWWHSVHRYMWWLVVCLGWWRWWQQIVMYHDFWLFHPFPSRVYDEQDIYASASWKWYMQASPAWYMRPLVCIKWCLSRLTLFMLRSSCCVHLVPSAYMVPLVKAHLWPAVHVETLPHFVV